MEERTKPEVQVLDHAQLLTQYRDIHICGIYIYGTNYVEGIKVMHVISKVN